MKFARKLSSACRSFRQRRFTRRVSRRLMLKQNQQEKLELIAEKLFNGRASTSNWHHQTHIEVSALLNEQTFDAKKADDILQYYMNNFEQQAKELIEGFAEFFNSLEKKQQQQLQHYLLRRSQCREYYS